MRGWVAAVALSLGVLAPGLLLGPAFLDPPGGAAPEPASTRPAVPLRARASLRARAPALDVAVKGTGGVRLHPSGRLHIEATTPLGEPAFRLVLAEGRLSVLVGRVPGCRPPCRPGPRHLLLADAPARLHALTGLSPGGLIGLLQGRPVSVSPPRTLTWDRDGAGRPRGAILRDGRGSRLLTLAWSGWHPVGDQPLPGAVDLEVPALDLHLSLAELAWSPAGAPRPYTHAPPPGVPTTDVDASAARWAARLAEAALEASP